MKLTIDQVERQIKKKFKKNSTYYKQKNIARGNFKRHKNKLVADFNKLESELLTLGLELYVCKNRR